jgi:sulfonate transport system substrate-binding protein
MITAVSPFGFDPELREFGRPLFHQVDAIGRSQMIVRVARDSLLKEHREAMVDFMEDYLRALRYLLDPAHHSEAVALLAQVTKREPAFYDAWAFTKQDYFRDPAALPDLDALQSNVDLQQSLGFLRSPIDVKKQADLSIAKEAADRLGK